MSLHNKLKQKYSLHPASHMTAIENLPQILEHGILSYNAMVRKTYTKLSNDDVQHGRSKITVSLTGRLLHDYVPLYFGLKTPMVACNQHRNESLIFLRVPLDILTESGVVFTDGNARSNVTRFYRYTDLDSLSVLNVKSIHTVKYADDLEIKRQKQAEVLVPDRLDFSKVTEIFVFSKAARDCVLAVLLHYDKSPVVSVASGWYFHQKVEL